MTAPRQVLSPGSPEGGPEPRGPFRAAQLRLRRPAPLSEPERRLLRPSLAALFIYFAPTGLLQTHSRLV